MTTDRTSLKKKSDNARQIHRPELRLLQLLSDRYPSVTAAHIEMINLSAILALPKGTDHYISDIHGAYDQFDHILRHASGAIRRKISQTLGDELSQQQQIDLAMLIYYPEQKLRQMLASLGTPQGWMAETIAQLARVARTSAQKYTRSKMRKRLAPRFAYILEELLTESQTDNLQKEQYYESIVQSILALGEGEHGDHHAGESDTEPAWWIASTSLAISTTAARPPSG